MPDPNNYFYILLLYRIMLFNKKVCFTVQPTSHAHKNQCKGQSKILKSYKKQQQEYFQHQLKKIINQETKRGKAYLKMQKDLEQYEKHKEGTIDLAMSEKQKLRRFYREKSQQEQKKHSRYLQSKEKEKARLQLIKENSLKKIRQLKSRRKIKEEEMRIKKQERQSEIINRTNNYIEERFHSTTSNLIKSPAKAILQRNYSTPFLNKSEKEEKEEKKKIMNYVSKMRKNEEKIMKKEAQKEKSRQKSYFGSVKCFIADRARKENLKMEESQHAYNKRILSFSQTRANLEKSKQDELSEKSLHRQSMRAKVLEKREKQRYYNLKKNERTVKKKMIQGWQTSQDNKVSDDSKARASYEHNAWMLRMEKKEHQHERNMRFIFQKVKKIRENESHKKLTAKEQFNLENFLDRRDKSYKIYRQFMESSKEAFLQKRYEEEEASKKKKKNS